jgi:hypothetical protein
MACCPCMDSSDGLAHSSQDRQAIHLVESVLWEHHVATPRHNLIFWLGQFARLFAGHLAYIEFLACHNQSLQHALRYFTPCAGNTERELEERPGCHSVSLFREPFYVYEMMLIMISL